jgi:glycosyltransferase involved in cell wall biosynthesis
LNYYKIIIYQIRYEIDHIDQKRKTMLTVIIPALNEEKTIKQVVSYCLSEPSVTEVIVVDDKSEDSTADIAKAAGAKIIISASRGKGISMKEGIDASTNEFIIFLDADIDPYP